MPDFRFEQNHELAKTDYVVDQGWEGLTKDHHAIWRAMYERQQKILEQRAAPEWSRGIHGLEIATRGIPNYEDLSDILEDLTGWRIVAVPGLVPDEVFFRHLANRRWPATNWIRSREQTPTRDDRC